MRSDGKFGQPCFDFTGVVIIFVVADKKAYAEKRHSTVIVKIANMFVGWRRFEIPARVGIDIDELNELV